MTDVGTLEAADEGLRVSKEEGMEAALCSEFNAREGSEPPYDKLGIFFSSLLSSGNRSSGVFDSAKNTSTPSASFS